jgi:hypothetical protein
MSATPAAAYWDGSGTGDASAQTSRDPLRLSEAPLVSSMLYPGAIVRVELSVVNDEDRAFLVRSIESSAAQVSAGPAGCEPTAVALVASPQSVAVAANGQAVISAELRMNVDADPACQGRTFTVPITVVGTPR